MSKIQILKAQAAGAMLLSAAGVCELLSQAHMRSLGTICGSAQAPHCGWCYAAVALSALAAVAVTAPLSAKRVALRVAGARRS